MICFDCSGSGRLPHWHYQPPCPRCNGTGDVSDLTPDWMAHGERLRMARHRAEVPAYVMAKRLGIRSIQLERIETGQVDNLEVEYEF